MGVPVISKRIYEGATAEELRISKTEYESRRKIVDRFVAQWGEERSFEEDFLEWLREDQSSPPATVSSSEESRPETKSTGMPSLSDMAIGLGESLASIAKSGVAVASKEEHNRRYQICAECVNFTNGRCSICGCFMKIKAKFAAMRCPADFW